MPCLVPFNGDDLDITMFAWRPTVVFPEELIQALKYFSFYAEDLGCFCSSVMTSIHGSMVIWLGSWAKRSNESREILHSALCSTARSLSSMADLLHFGFFATKSGESKDGRRCVRFSTGDTVSLVGAWPISRERADDLSYACVALLKSTLTNEQGITAGVVFRCTEKPLMVVLYVWDSPTSCYSWLLARGYRASAIPYISHLSSSIAYDLFKVVFVSTDDVLNLQFLASMRRSIEGISHDHDHDHHRDHQFKVHAAQHRKQQQQEKSRDHTKNVIS